MDRARDSGSSGMNFSEVMVGHIQVGDVLDGRKESVFDRGAQNARGLCEGAKFFLSIRAMDIEKREFAPTSFTSWTKRLTCLEVVKSSDHSALLTGSFTCAKLPGSPFMVHRGNFRLFSTDLETTGTKNLIYDFDMVGINGEIYHFHGFKCVDSSVTFNPLALWKATSTLYVTITFPGGSVVGRGVLHVQPLDFISQATTIAATGPTLLAKSQSMFSFLKYFTKESASLFLTPFMGLQYPHRFHDGFTNPTPASEVIQITASDGVKSTLRMWEACPTDPNLEIHDLFMIPGAAVDHQIFALPTISHNAVNYFTKAGYRVWVIVHRIGMSPEEKKNWTGYDSRLDIRAALEYIRKVQGPQKIYTISHCVGSIAFSCGLLDGTVRKPLLVLN
jgi:hypothetical protein